MSNSNQEIIEARLATYVDGELDPAERIEIETHLEQNPQYRRLVEELRKGREMLRGLPREAAPSEMAEAFASQLERSVLLDGGGETDLPRMRIGAWPRVFTAAAIVFLTFGLAGIVYFALPDRSRVVATNNPAARPVVPSASAVRNNDNLSKDDASKRDPSKPAPLANGRGEELAGKLRENAGENLALKKDAAQPEAPVTPAVTLGGGGDRPTPDGPGGLAAKQDGFSRNSALGRRGGSSTIAEERKNELEQLAKNAAENRQVIALLAASEPENAQPLASNAVVIVVRSNDSQHIEKALLEWGVRRNIDVQPVRERTAVAINQPVPQPTEQLSDKAATAADRDAKAKLSESARLLQDDRKQGMDAAVAGAAPRAPAARPVAHAGQPKPASMAQADKGGAPPAMAKGAPVQPSDPAAAPAPVAATATTVPAEGPPALSDLETRANQATAAAQSAPAPPRAAAPASAVTDLAKSSVDKLAKLQNGKTIEHLYVARGLSRQDAQGLNDSLALMGEVSQSEVLRSAGDKHDKFGFGGSNRGMAPKGAAQAPAAPQRAEKREADFRAEGGRAGTTQPAIIVQKGDELRLRYGVDKDGKELAETVRVNDAGDIEPQSVAPAKRKAVQVAGKTVDEVERELQPVVEDKSAASAPGAKPVTVTVLGDDDLTRPADVGAAKPSQTASIDALKQVQQRRATSVPALADAAPSTAPSPANLETIDVVILVERDETPSPSKSTVPSPATSHVVAPAPTTAPSTQPVPLPSDAPPDPAK